ncbi:MAG: sigma-70 family RNA polymerase sigma factor [Actinomycetota bacterium]
MAGDDDLIRMLGSPRGEAALRELYHAHAAGLMGYALARLRDRGLAEEAVQDVFTRIWRHADAYDPSAGSPRAWIYGIARNAVIDLERRRAVRPPLPGAREAEGEEPGEESIEVAMLRWQVRGAMAQLRPEHREIIRLMRLEGLTLKEAAERTGLPVGTVKSRLYYALQALRLALEEAGALP